ncbi:MAG: hypothetical protein R3208_21760 [Ketobacteraceae bacterium]|nr:hypothetical protein [Ketobacteraceae bacterium]
MSDRSIKVSGSFNGVANTGNDNVIIGSGGKDTATQYLAAVFEGLNEQFPESTEEFKRECVKQKLQNDIKAGKPAALSLKDALLNGSQEVVAMLSDNPFVRISVAMLRGWIQ